MKKLVKLPLPMNGELCKSIEDLQKNINVYDLLEHFESGKLEIWLRSRKFKQLAAIQAIDKDLEKKEIARKLYSTFIVELDSNELLNALMVLEYQSKFDSKNIERKNIEEVFNHYAEEIKLTYESKIQKLEGKVENNILPAFKDQKKVDHYLVSDSKGLAIDTKTNLMWTRFSLGEKYLDGKIVGKQEKYTWNKANLELVIFNNSSGDTKYSDWRIPTLDELLSLLISFGLDRTPNINKLIFPSDYSRYWTSSAASSSYGSEYNAYMVDFETNMREGTSKSRKVSVILVRDNKGK